jgi:hypothetical protein
LDPTGITGKFNMGDGHYYIDGQNIFLASQHSSMPLGSFNLTNGYKTLEFTPAQECGRNTCGNPVFCMPVCDKPSANCSQDHMKFYCELQKQSIKILLKHSLFQVVTDLAGNALDGNKNNIPNNAGSALPVFPNQKQPDNYFWSFSLVDRLDVSSPFIQTIVPGIDAERIASDQEVSMVVQQKNESRIYV